MRLNMFGRWGVILSFVLTMVSACGGGAVVTEKKPDAVGPELTEAVGGGVVGAAPETSGDGAKSSEVVKLVSSDIEQYFESIDQDPAESFPIDIKDFWYSEDSLVEVDKLQILKIHPHTDQVIQTKNDKLIFNGFSATLKLDSVYECGKLIVDHLSMRFCPGTIHWALGFVESQVQNAINQAVELGLKAQADKTQVIAQVGGSAAAKRVLTLVSEANLKEVDKKLYKNTLDFLAYMNAKKEKAKSKEAFQKFDKWLEYRDAELVKEAQERKTKEINTFIEVMDGGISPPQHPASEDASTEEEESSFSALKEIILASGNTIKVDVESATSGASAASLVLESSADLLVFSNLVSLMIRGGTALSGEKLLFTLSEGSPPVHRVVVLNTQNLSATTNVLSVSDLGEASGSTIRLVHTARIGDQKIAILVEVNYDHLVLLTYDFNSQTGVLNDKHKVGASLNGGALTGIQNSSSWPDAMSCEMAACYIVNRVSNQGLTRSFVVRVDLATEQISSPQELMLGSRQLHVYSGTQALAEGKFEFFGAEEGTTADGITYQKSLISFLWGTSGLQDLMSVPVDNLPQPAGPIEYYLSDLDRRDSGLFLLYVKATKTHLNDTEKEFIKFVMVGSLGNTSAPAFTHIGELEAHRLTTTGSSWVSPVLFQRFGSDGKLYALLKLPLEQGSGFKLRLMRFSVN